MLDIHSHFQNTAKQQHKYKEINVYQKNSKSEREFFTKSHPKIAFACFFSPSRRQLSSNWRHHHKLVFFYPVLHPMKVATFQLSSCCFISKKNLKCFIRAHLQAF